MGEKTNPCVTIIVPVYKVEPYLKRCLDSIRSQTFQDVEVILVDDGSPDSCPQMCDEAAGTDKRFQVIHKENQGLGFARNSGLEIARGEYVYFVDSDDYLEKTAVETLYREAKADDLDICFAGTFLVSRGKAEREVPKYAGKIFTQPEIVEKVLADMLGTAPEEKVDCTVPMSVWQGIYKRSWLEEHGFRFRSEREFVSEDIIFHLDCLPFARKIGYLPQCLYYYVKDNPSSLTHVYRRDRLEKHGFLYLEELRKTEPMEYREEMRRRIQRTYIGNARICLQQLIEAGGSMKRRDFRKEFRRLVRDPVLQSVLKEYPYWRAPWKQRILSFCLRYKKEKIVFFLTWMFLKVGKRRG